MENLTTYIDGYCERVTPGLFDEPLNAITNLAFIFAALLVWYYLKSRNPPTISILLTVTLALIGVGSGLLHTFATVWGAIADVFFIAVFVIVYIYGANRYFFKLKTLYSIILTILVFALLIPLGYLIQNLFPFIGGSSTYASIATIIFIYGFLLLKSDKVVGIKLLIGGVILSISIGFRIIDLPYCEDFHLGTHWVWHVLNAVMLSWMILIINAKILLDEKENKLDETK